VEGDQIIKLFQRFRIFPKAHLDTGAQKGRLDAAWILSERFVAVLNGEFVFALLLKNLRANVERWPQFGIDSKRRINIALCTDNITIS